jgi:hypothetical protein
MMKDIFIKSEEDWAKAAYDNAKAKLSSLAPLEDEDDTDEDDELLVEETE